MMCWASWRVILPVQMAVFSAFSVLSLALAPTSDGGKGPRKVSGVPGVPHVSGHRFFASRGLPPSSSEMKCGQGMAASRHDSQHCFSLAAKHDDWRFGAVCGPASW